LVIINNMDQREFGIGLLREPSCAPQRPL